MLTRDRKTIMVIIVIKLIEIGMDIIYIGSNFLLTKVVQLLYYVVKRLAKRLTQNNNFYCGIK